MGRAIPTILRALAAGAVLAAGVPSAAAPLHAERGQGPAEGPWPAEEDFARAFAAARAQGALVLVDVWAPW